VYLLLEPVTNGEGRLRLSKFGFLSGECAYIINRDRENSDIDPIRNYGKTAGFTSNDLYISYPGRKNITDKEYDWITKDVSKFEMALYGEDFTDPRKGYAAYIDTDNFVDYYLFNEIFMNHDGGVLSTYAYKELGGKLKLVLWDYNNSYDNYQWFSEPFDEFFLKDAPWFERLLEDRSFVDKIVDRYYELRKTTFSEEHMYELIDGTTDYLGPAVERNFRVWGYVFQGNHLIHSSRNATSYEDAVSRLKNAIDQRFLFLDEHIKDLYEYCQNE
jgi:hypothetical protein